MPSWMTAMFLAFSSSQTFFSSLFLGFRFCSGFRPSLARSSMRGW